MREDFIGRGSEKVILGKMSQQSKEKPRQEAPDVGLCEQCRWMRKLQSDRGSTFYMCQRSATDPNFPKYPRLPVLRCAGYDPMDSAEQ